MDFEGISAVLSVCPYYNKPTQEGIYQHYKNVASASPVPIILYNVPGRTSVNMEAKTTLRLAENENIAAIKEASGNMYQMMQILRDKPRNFHLISGDDALTLATTAIGGSGVISVIANALPFEFSELVRKTLDGKTKAAVKINNKLLELYKYLFCEGNPAGIKAALHSLGLIENNLRQPLVPVCKDTYNIIKAEVEKVKAEEIK